MQGIDWGQVNMGEVHRVWHILQAIQLQPPNLAYTYEMFGMSPGTLETLLGAKAIAKIFAGATAGTVDTIAAHHAVPDQVINLLRVQLQKLATRLESEQAQGQYDMEQTGAKAALDKCLPSLQSERRKRGSKPY